MSPFCPQGVFFPMILKTNSIRA